MKVLWLKTQCPSIASKNFALISSSVSSDLIRWWSTRHAWSLTAAGISSPVSSRKLGLVLRSMVSFSLKFCFGIRAVTFNLFRMTVIFIENAG